MFDTSQDPVLVTFIAKNLIRAVYTASLYLSFQSLLFDVLLHARKIVCVWIRKSILQVVGTFIFS